jgi:hypothetical protein
MKKQMKALFSILITVVVMSAWAQIPQQMNYQAVVRDVNGQPVANSNVKMRFTIHDVSTNGAAVFQETATVASNLLGLVTYAIGSSNNLAIVNWSSASKFLQVEVDITGGSNYVDMGTTQLLSVPYALYAAESQNSMTGWNISGNTSTNPGSNFLGTIDNKSLVLKTNNFERMRIDSSGNVAIGISSAQNHLHLFGGDAKFEDSTSFGEGYTTIGGGGLDLYRAPVGPAANQNGFIDFKKDTAHDMDFRIVWNKFIGTNGGLQFISTTDGQLLSTGVSRLVILNENGNVGVGVTPARSLHVKDVMRIEPRSSAPSSPSKGDIYFDNTTDKLCVYDGTMWQNCW